MQASDVTRIDTSVPHPARVYDYFLGGKDNYGPDRALAEAMIEQLPILPGNARANRAFLGRAVPYLAGELGIRQFLDIGSGLPTNRNVHQIAQEIAPESRVLYVDNDPIVLTHGRALLSSGPEGRTGFLGADATDPQAVLRDPALAEVLDLDQPVALMLVCFLMYFPDEVAHDIVGTLMEALPSGSALTISHPTGDFDPEALGRLVAATQAGGIRFQVRSAEEIGSFFSGLGLVDPGISPLLAWRPDGPVPDPHGVHFHVGMGVKP